MAHVISIIEHSNLPRMGLFAYGESSAAVCSPLQSLGYLLSRFPAPITGNSVDSISSNREDELDLALVLADESGYEYAKSIHLIGQSTKTLIWCRFVPSNVADWPAMSVHTGGSDKNFEASFYFSDDDAGRETCCRMCEAIVHAIGVIGPVGIDLADVRRVLNFQEGTAVGYAYGSAEQAEAVTQNAISHDLLGTARLQSAKGCLVVIHTRRDRLRRSDIRDVLHTVDSIVPEDCFICHSVVYVDPLSNELAVTILAAGITSHIHDPEI